MRGLATAAVIGASLLTTPGCGATAPVLTAPETHAVAATGTMIPATDPCAAVTTTTPVDEVTLACRERWSPYDVTEIPPSKELQMEHVPAAPTVVNMTGGAVPDTTAQRWADASNRDSGWWKWAEASDQLFFLRHLVGPALIPAADVEALQNGAAIAQPDCNLYPISSKLFAIGPEGRAYFARRNEHIDDRYVFVVAYSGPCSETVRAADGRFTSIVDLTTTTTVFTPGVLRNDPVLGDIWFGDAGGSCQDPLGPPAAWCGR